MSVNETDDITLPDHVTTHPLHLSINTGWDYFSALEYGRVSDGWARDCRLGLESCDLLFLLATPFGPVVGFEVFGWKDFELPDDEPDVWDGPRFDVPRLGLTQVSVGEIVLAARAQFPDAPTVDGECFAMALAEPDDERALIHWERALDAGDMKAHFGWGCALMNLGRPREAYLHLRRYTELTPVNSWAWHWRAQACEALGEREEAIRCYRRAIDCEDICGYETDADERLTALLDATT